MKIGNFVISQGEVEGYELLAPASYWTANRETIEELAGGCGPGKIGDWFVPDSLLGENIRPACEIHDWMYHFGKTAEDKFISDLVLDWNIKVMILTTPGVDEPEKEFFDRVRLEEAGIYFKAVFYHGGEAFSSGKTPSKEEVDVKEDS